MEYIYHTFLGKRANGIMALESPGIPVSLKNTGPKSVDHVTSKCSSSVMYSPLCPGTTNGLLDILPDSLLVVACSYLHGGERGGLLQTEV